MLTNPRSAFGSISNSSITLHLPILVCYNNRRLVKSESEISAGGNLPA